MTPAVQMTKKSNVPFTLHEYTHDASSESYGLEAAEKLGVPAERVFKTLVVMLDNQQLAVGIVPVAAMLGLKPIAKALGVKKAVMADKALVERTTGYVLGGVSPLGQKKRLPTVVDSSAEAFATIYVSAGRRGLEIELKPQDLVALTQGRFQSICQV